MKGQSLQFSDSNSGWLVGDAPFGLKFALKVIHPLRNTSTLTDFSLGL